MSAFWGNIQGMFAYPLHSLSVCGYIAHQAKVSVMTTTLHYGTGCFGGLRAYWSEQRQELFAFRLIEHYTRFLNSCKLLMAELPYTAQNLADITVELLRKEKYRGDVYIRPLHYKADLHGALQVHGMMDEVTIYACVQPHDTPVRFPTRTH